MTPSPLRPILSVTALLGVCLGMLCVSESVGKVALILQSPDAITISGASINSAGDTLTVTFSGAATLTNATGFSVTFDNYAERTLTYSSGSGTTSVAFSIAANATYTDADTDNDAAPVGTVCTLDYDSGAGNVLGLSDVTDQSVTNNSTAHPDPDLPLQLSTTRPANWNATADYTPADAAELQELLDGDGEGDAANGTANDWTKIVLASDGTNYGPLTIDDTCQYILIMSDDYASLPSAGTRLPSTADGNGYLALFSRTSITQAHYTLTIESGDGQAGTNHIWMIGLKFVTDGTFNDTVATCFCGTYSGSRDTSENPTHIVFDQCKIGSAADTAEVREGIRFDCNDSMVLDCRFEYGPNGAGSDGTIGVRNYSVERQLIQNNRFITDSGSVFIAGDNGITRADDITVRSNHGSAPTGADNGNGVQKSDFESKAGLRVLVENNVFETRTFMTGGHATIQFKADGTPAEAKNTSHGTVRNNLIYNVSGQAIQFHIRGSSGDANTGPNHDFKAYNNLCYDTGSFAMAIQAQTGMERVKVIHNTLMGTVGGSIAGENPGDYLLMRDNIVGGAYFENAVANGSSALNTAWDAEYVVQYNAWIGELASMYDNDTSPVPLGTLSNNIFPADNTAMDFADEGSGDYSLNATSPGYQAASDGTDMGVDVSALNTELSGVEE